MKNNAAMEDHWSNNPRFKSAQEPVAWMDADGERVVTAKQKAGMHESLQASFPVALGYTAPPQRTWVGLTTEDRVEILRAKGEAAVMQITEAKLKEKNT